MEYSNSPGSRIKALRLQHSLTQKELGRMVGVSAASVTQWEKDIQLPKGDNAAKLCKILSSNWDWIRHGKESDTDSGINENKASYSTALKLDLIDKASIPQYLENRSSVDSKQIPSEPALHLGASSNSFAYIEVDEGMLHRITPGDKVFIDPSSKLTITNQSIYMFMVNGQPLLGSIKQTPKGLTLQFDNTEPGWESVMVNESDYVGKVVAYIPKWLN